MATIALIETADEITTGIGDVVTVSASVDTGARPIFYSPDTGRRLASEPDDLGIWTATWATSAAGDYAIRVEAPMADPVIVVVTVTGDGPPAPDYYGTDLLDQAYDARDAAQVARTAALAASATATTERIAAQVARGGAETARAAAEDLVTADLGTTDAQARALLDNPTSLTAKYIDGRLTRAALAAGRRLRARARGNARQVAPVTVGAIGSSIENSMGVLTYVGSSRVWTSSAPHGLTPGTRVRFQTSGRTGIGFLNGTVYYVLATPSTTTFTVTATQTGTSTPDLGGDGSVLNSWRDIPLTVFAYTRGFQTTTITAATDTWATPTPHFFAVGDTLSVTGSTAGGVTNGTIYYVRSTPSATTFTVALSPNGTTVDVTSDGTASLGRPNPAFQFTDWRPAQAASGAPQHDYVRPDLTVTQVGAGAQVTGEMTSSVRLTGGDGVDIYFFNDSASDYVVLVEGIEVDYVTSAQLGAAGIGSGSNAAKSYRFPDSRARTISVRSRGRLVAIAHPPTVTVSNPNTITGPTFLLTGDSLTEGTGSTSAVRYGYGAWVRKLLGADIWVAGSGSTGYRADGARLALEDRYITDIVNQSKDVNVIAMGLNDPRTDATARTATVNAATGIWDATLAALPTSEMVILGPWSPKGIGTNGTEYRDPNLVALDLALSIAATARGLRYISPIQEGWITGDGKVGATTGRGNSDTYVNTDGTHFTDAGHEYVGMRLAGHLAVAYAPTPF